MQNHPVDRRLLLVLAVMVAGCYGLLLLGLPFVDQIIREDGIVENVGTVGFFLTAVFLILAWWQLRQQQPSPHWFKLFAYVGLAALFLFVAGEEISWGQRIFDFETPDELREINTQDEFNFHNLEVIQENSLLNTDRLFTMFALGFALLLPLTAVLHPPTGRWLNQLLPVAPWLLGLLFLFNYGAANLFRPLFEGTVWYQSSYPLKHSVVEMKEAIFGLLFALVAFYLFRLASGNKTA